MNSGWEIGSLADWFSGGMSALAVIVALAGYWLGARSAKIERRRLQTEAAHRILIKLLTIVNGLYTLHLHIERDAAREPLHGPDGPELWRTIQPLIGFTDDDEVQIDAIESTLLVEAKAIDFLLDLMLAAKRNTALIAAMKEYAVRREALQTLSPPPIGFEGQIGTVGLTQQQYLAMRPYAIALEALIQHVRTTCKLDLEAAKRLADQFGPLMRTHLNDAGFPILETKDAEEGVYSFSLAHGAFTPERG